MLRRRLLLRRLSLSYAGRVKGWGFPRAVRALQTGRNVVNAIHAWPRSPAYEMRLTKYACRGFAVLCPAWTRVRRSRPHPRRRRLTRSPASRGSCASPI